MPKKFRSHHGSASAQPTCAGDGSGAATLRPTFERTISGRWSMLVILALTAGIVVFFRLGTFKTLQSHEAFASVPAGEMLSSGDWIVPRFGGLPRLTKPPLVYWINATIASFFGEMNEWTVRLPSAISALLLAGLVGFWARRRYGSIAGFGSALVQSTSAYVIIFSRKAEVDMFLCLLTTTAMFLIEWLT